MAVADRNEMEKIIEYVEQGRFICALALQDNNKRLRVMTQNGRELNLPKARIVYQTEAGSVSRVREEVMAHLRQVGERRQEMADSLDLTDVWELAVEEDDDSFNPRFLTELVFGDGVDGDRVAAFIRAVFRDKLYFKYRNGAIVVHSAEVVEQLRENQERERQREAMLVQGADALVAIMAEKEVPSWPDGDKCLAMIADYYLLGSEAEEADLARDLLKRANLKRPHDPFHLLVKAGVWVEDENLALAKFDVPLSFSPEAMAQAATAEMEAEDLLADGRVDLRHLPLLTIDAASTRDLDDALHVERKGDDFQVGIHIADVTAGVKKGDPLFKTALERGTSLYFADGQVPMLPPKFSEGFCSLIAGKVRPAITYLVTLKPDGEVVDYKIIRSVVEVKRRLSYLEVEDLLASDEDLQHLQSLSAGLQQRRVVKEAMILPIPDVNISPTAEGVRVELSPVDSKSRTLVAEFMVLANSLTARYLVDREIPALFRSQEPAKKRLAAGVTKDIFTNFRQRRFLCRGELLVRPKPHSGVGASQYTTATSPIRRLLDLLIQQQLINVLRGLPLYMKGDWQDFAAMITQSQGRANQASRQRHRYWLLKYLATEVGVDNEVEVLILDIQPRRIQVVLTDILLEGDLPLNQGPRVEPGDLVKVKIAKVSLLDDSFRLAW